MKRKLIDFEVFNKIKDESLSTAEFELAEAEDVLARALAVDQLNLHCFGESDVTYETADKTYVHATYQITEGNIYFENIEELVIDENSAKQESRKILSKLVDELLNNNENKASNAFEQYLALPTVRRGLMEGKVDFWVEPPTSSKPHKKRGPQTPDDIAKRVRAKKKNQSLISASQKKIAKQHGKSLKAPFGKGAHVHARFKPEPKHQVKKASKKMLKDWFTLSENVSGYIDYQEFGPVMKESEIQHDDKGNPVAIRIPTSFVRNEAKILNLTYKHMLDTELKVCRGKMKTVHEDGSFCHAMADLRKCNALSDQAGLQEVLEAIVTKWPEVLYLTQAELSRSISLALETVGDSNYDDQMCEFMAEGILRTATDLFSDRMNKVVRLTGATLDKDHVYESFQAIVHKFYPTLDENSALEMQVFVDLYNALVEVHKVAGSEGNEALRSEAHDFLRSLDSVIKQESEPTLELAGQVAGWLANLVESNVTGSEENWAVSNTPHQTISGDHPRMSWAAKQDDAVASKYPGDWPGKLPVSDGKSYKNNLEDEMRNRSWGNWSDENCWPQLKNPYTPKPFGDYTMKGEKGADKDGESDWSRYQSSETWPNLQNPAVKPSPWDTSKYRMKSDNLLVDK